MKQFTLFSIFLLSFLLLTSCKKDKEEVPPTKIEIAGEYVGKYGTGTNTPSVFYSFNIKEDGTLQELSSAGSVVGTGTWTMNGTKFRASYHYVFPLTSFFAVAANYDPSTNKLSGTWGYGDNDSDGGKFQMSRK